MRTINIYKFRELPTEARSKVAARYLAGLDVENFERGWKEQLEQKFPSSHSVVFLRDRRRQPCKLVRGQRL